jgi:hypothetical protein
MVIILAALAILHSCLFILAFRHVRGSGDKTGFIYHWGIMMGAFVWVDLLVFSLAFLLGTIITILAHDLRVGLLLLAAFWLVRSSGEVLYFFLQQFHQPTRAPHEISAHFGALRAVFGDISLQKCFIIMQIFWQVVAAGSLSATILIAITWQKLVAWF